MRGHGFHSQDQFPSRPQLVVAHDRSGVHMWALIRYLLYAQFWTYACPLLAYIYSTQ